MNKSGEQSKPTMNDAETQAFVEMFGKVQHGVRSFILSLVMHWDEADEVFQKTSLILWRKFGEFDPQTDFRKWACQVAFYEVLKWRHQRRADSKKVGLSEEVMERLADDLAEDSELVDMRHQALAKCLDKLRDVDRQLVDLRYYSETSIQQVAEQVGRSPDAVYKAINRIRWSLLDCIQRRLRGEGT